MASEQQMLEFPVAAHTGRVMRSSAESRRVCHEPVAPRIQRAVAAAIDFTLVLLAAGMAGLVLQYGPLKGLSLWGAAAWLCGLTGGLTLVYKLIWVLTESDSPGVRWAGLRTVNFDGRPVTQQERLKRFGAGTLTIAPVGFGLLWAMWDEESLTIYDHMSSTFLTPETGDE